MEKRDPVSFVLRLVAFLCGMLAKDSREGEGLGNDRAGRVLRKDGAKRELWGHLGLGGSGKDIVSHT